MLFFTAQNANTVGRIDPKTGEITGQKTPTHGAKPYGIESAIKPNVLVRFDIKTNKFQSRIMPGGGGAVRNIKTTDVAGTS
jgi:hypothetical protein